MNKFRNTVAVLALLCAEAFLGSITRVTKGINLRSLFGSAPAS